MPYDLFAHRHNFAVWAAARAVQRGWKGADVQNLKAALESCGIHRYLPDPAFMEVNCVRFEELHKLWCKAIVASLSARNIADATYGRAAKLIAIYLKTMVITGGFAYTNIGRCIHPPIDSRLLKALAADSQFDQQKRNGCQQTKWTQLDENAYDNLIKELRGVFPSEVSFWMLEEYWTPSDDDE